MNEKLLGELKALMSRWNETQSTPEPNRLDISIEPDDLLDATSALYERAYLVAITGLDVGDIEVLYHFCIDGIVVTLRVKLARDTATIASICKIIPSARLYEREIREMFGVKVAGLADEDYLFLPEDWPDAVYPLRKDAVLS